MYKLIPFFESQLAESVRHHGRAICLGKGPSVGKFLESPRMPEFVVAINDACRLTDQYDVVHFTDLEAAQRCRPHANRAVLAPYYPHVDSKPRPDRPITSMMETCWAFRQAAHNSRLYVYWSSATDPKKFAHPKLPLGSAVHTKLFSAVAVTDLLLKAGAKQIRYFGIDEGDKYHESFSDLVPLTNGRKDFGGQHKVIKKLAKQAGSLVFFAKGN